MSTSNNKIFVVTHKDFDKAVLPYGYSTILAGGEFNKANDVDYFDNQGINISKLNRSFCELTAQYWVWKNTVCDNLAFVHYRRFFQSDNKFNDANEIIKADELFDDLSKHDVILAKPVYSIRSVRSSYGAVHGFDDLDKLRNVIALNSPEYLPSFDSVMNSHGFSPFNMFAMSFELFDSYMTWLFALLVELEKEIDLSGRSVYETRVFGFLAERLLNVWVAHNTLDIKYLPVSFLGESSFVQNAWEKLKEAIFH